MNAKKAKEAKPLQAQSKSKNTKFAVPGIPIEAHSGLKKEEITLEKIITFAARLQKYMELPPEADFPLRITMAYVKTLIVLTAFTQWVQGSKKANKGIDIKVIQKDSQHRFYADKLSRDPEIQTLLNLIGTLSVVKYIPKSEIPEGQTPLDVAWEDYQRLSTREGAATKRVNPRLSKDSRLAYARGVILATRGTWVGIPYYKPETLIRTMIPLKVEQSDITEFVRAIALPGIKLEEITNESLTKEMSTENYAINHQTELKTPPECSQNMYPVEKFFREMSRNVIELGDKEYVTLDNVLNSIIED